MKNILASRPARFWIALLVLWTLPALSSMYRAFTFERLRDGSLVIPPAIPAWYLKLFIGPLLVIAPRRLRLTSRFGLRELGWHLVLLGLITITQAAVLQGAARAIANPPRHSRR